MSAARIEVFGIEGFTPYRDREHRDRELPCSLFDVQVYRNLNEQRRTGRVCWSIRDTDTRLVVGHATKLALENARVHVNTAAQERIAAGEFRTVHAWVTGRLAFCPTDLSPWYAHAQRVIYRPHESPQFRYERSDAAFVTGSLVRFDEHGMWAWQ